MRHEIVSQLEKAKTALFISIEIHEGYMKYKDVKTVL